MQGFIIEKIKKSAFYRMIFVIKNRIINNYVFLSRPLNVFYYVMRTKCLAILLSIYLYPQVICAQTFSFDKTHDGFLVFHPIKTDDAGNIVSWYGEEPGKRLILWCMQYGIFGMPCAWI
jgi:hypothetical protein